CCRTGCLPDPLCFLIWQGVDRLVHLGKMATRPLSTAIGVYRRPFVVAGRFRSAPNSRWCSRLRRCAPRASQGPDMGADREGSFFLRLFCGQFYRPILSEDTRLPKLNRHLNEIFVGVDLFAIFSKLFFAFGVKCIEEGVGLYCQLRIKFNYWFYSFSHSGRQRFLIKTAVKP